MGACNHSTTVDKKNEMQQFPKKDFKNFYVNDAQFNTLEREFPGAVHGIKLDQQVTRTLTELGFDDDNTLFADSTCPDEINHNDPDTDVTSLFQKRWGELFPLGGLAGLPFTGKTGWHAFSSHCPDDGHILILFAPHVGLDYTGKVGSVFRDGQTTGSSACGAAIGAHGFNKANQGKSGINFESGYLDHQMDCIKHLLAPKTNEIAGAKNEMAKLAYSMFEIHRDFLESILHYKWMGPNSKLAICGGIQINCDGYSNDHFLPLMFDVRSKNGDKQDLYQKTFGRESPIIEYARNNGSTDADS